MTLRPPAVAGLFYPGNPVELREMIEKFTSAPGEKRAAKAVMVPHAGYIYSGKTAGAVYSWTLLPRRFLILGPNHTGLGPALSLSPSGAWETPLGEAPVDVNLNEVLLAACPAVRPDAEGHRREHAIEVQLPFLQTLTGDFRFAALTVAEYELRALESLGGAIASVIESNRDVLLVVSSDMTHYEDAESARCKDSYAIEAMEALDAAALFRAVNEKDISMCGFAPAVAAMAALKKMGASSGELLDYTNSGDASGDYERVVAYAGMRFA
jgi:hypothetical protein